MTNIINIDNTNIDLNSMMRFDFSFNFEILKKAIEALLRVQNFQGKKLLEIEEKYALNISEIIKNEVKNNITVMMTQEKKNSNRSKRNKVIQKIINEDNNEDDKTKEIINENNEIDDKTKEIVSEDDAKEEKEIKDDYDDVDYNPDVKRYEEDADFHNVNNIKIDVKRVSKKFIKIEENQNHFKQEISILKENLTNLDKKLGKEDFNRKFDNLNTQLNEINLKLLDFNIFDIIKNKSSNSGDKSDSGDVFILIQSFEKKFLKKFEINDEKIRRLDDEIYKLKNENINSITKFDKNQALINTLDENHRKINLKIEKINITVDELKDDLIKEIDEKINEFSYNLPINKNISDTNFGAEKSEIRTNNINNSNVNELDQKFQRELNRKFNDLEKSFKIFTKEIRIDYVYEKISQIDSDLIKKVGNEELLELKQGLNQSQNQINYIKDSMNQLMDDRHIIDDLNFLRKKIDNLSSTISSLKVEETNKVRATSEGNRFIDHLFFSEFRKTLQKDLDSLNALINSEIKNLSSDINNEIKTFVKEKDIRVLEEFITNKLEEYRLLNLKKFPDKNETVKNIKYLDTQIKNIIDVYIKKIEKGDNWLIAKKPIAGYSCASCENYLGELQENNQYIPWNKVPQDSGRLYRMGSGFSRMLNTINDNIVKNDEDHAILTHNSTETRLPRVKSNRNQVSNSNEHYNTNNSFNGKEKVEGTIHTEVDDGSSPKIVKIYKKRIKVVDKVLNTTEK